MLDTNLIQDEAPALPASSQKRWRSQIQLAPGLTPTPRPWLFLLLIGVALGPFGLGVLSKGVLSVLDPAVSAALATLGAFVGMEIDVRRPRENSLLFASSVEAGVTLVVVAAGVLVIHTLSAPSIAVPWLFATLLGMCAAPSAATASSDAQGAAGVGGFDAVLPIVLSMPALAAMRSPAPADIASLTLYFTLVCLAVAAACWLLVSRTSSITEERVFGIGALLLLGGAAAYLSMSALFAGFVAGVLWRAAGLEVRDRIIRDLSYLQHPVIAMLLLVAGATLHFSMALIGLVAAYLVCRTSGKLAGGWIASRLVSREARRDLGLSLISPGIVGVASALNVVQVQGGPDIGSMVFTLVVVGSLASDVASLVIREPERAR